MEEYEVIIDEVNPCGGSAHSIRSIIEVETESPEAYVNANARFPVMEVTKRESGDTVITTGDGAGYMVKYTFSK